MATEQQRSISLSVSPQVYPPEKSGHWDRSKGVYPDVIGSPAQMMRAALELQSFPFTPGVTRHGVTYAVTAEALAGLSDAERYTVAQLQEGIFPLAGSGVEGADYLMYMGHNTPQRRSTPEIIGEQLGKVQTIFGREHSGRHDLSAYDIRILTPRERQDADIQQQLLRLYGSTFGYSEEDVAGMLQSDSLIAAAFHGDLIVSGGVVEFSPLSFRRAGGGEVVISRAELTDGTTLRGEHNGEVYTGKGIYTGVSNELLRAAAQLAETGDLHIIFSESNLENPGVFAVAKSQGRQLPPQDVYGLGRRPLVQSCGIPGGKNGHGEAYNNLLPTYLVRDQLVANARTGRYDNR